MADQDVLTLFETLVMKAPIGLALLDRGLRYVRVNDAMAAMAGVRATECRGRALRDVFPALTPKLEPALRRVVETGEPVVDLELTDEAPAASGQARHWLATGYALSAGGGGESARIGLVLTDITPRRRADEERAALLARAQAARTEAEAANRAKDHFLATLSHELRAPLQAVLGWAQVLRSKSNDAVIKRAVDTIERNAKAQANLVNDLLDLSRIASGRLTVDLAPMTLHPVLNAALEAAQPAADAKQIRLTFLPRDATGLVMGDAARLRQVVSNLLSNAIKFTPTGGRITVTVEQDDASVTLSVQDTGCGISPAFLPEIFDRFSQADASLTRGHGGLGIGLAIVRHLVDLHGGAVSVESRGEGHGSTFRVTLPLMVDQPPTRSRRADLADAMPLPVLDGVRVLVVDDEADAREVLAAMLEACGADVTTTASVEEACTALAMVAPHVLVSDIAMPDDDGYSLIRRIRATQPIPAVALTAYAGAEDARRAIEAGFQAHLPKPVQAAELVAVVARLAGQSGTGDA